MRVAVTGGNATGRSAGSAGRSAGRLGGCAPGPRVGRRPRPRTPDGLDCRPRTTARLSPGRRPSRARSPVRSSAATAAAPSVTVSYTDEDVRADRRPVEAPHMARCRAPAAPSRRAGSPSSRTAASARASASSLANSSPAAPWSRTCANASRSRARTGAPADIASTRMMPKLSPPVLGATYTSTLRSSRALSSSLTMPRNSTRERSSGGQRLHGLLLVTAARDQQPCRRAARRGSSGAPSSGPAGPCGARRCGR